MYEGRKGGLAYNGMEVGVWRLKGIIGSMEIRVGQICMKEE